MLSNRKLTKKRKQHQKRHNKDYVIIYQRNKWCKVNATKIEQKKENKPKEVNLKRHTQISQIMQNFVSWTVQTIYILSVPKLQQQITLANCYLSYKLLWDENKIMLILMVKSHSSTCYQGKMLLKYTHTKHCERHQ